MTTLYFPQLTVGSLAQYPIARRWLKAITTDTLPDGSIVVKTGTAPARVTWDLRYSGLTAVEWAALQTLFNASQGRYGSFTFIDPSDNLLTWSEDLTAAAWTASPLLLINKGIGDPLGGSGAARVSNSGQASQRLIQSLAGPSWYQYCLSVYLRADAPTSMSLIRASASDEARQTVNVTGDWRRTLMSGILAGHDEEIQFGVELAAGTSLFIFGAQVEAQPSAGLYKPKYDRSGVYPKSRFDQDGLSQTTDTAGQYSTSIRITANY